MSFSPTFLLSALGSMLFCLLFFLSLRFPTLDSARTLPQNVETRSVGKSTEAKKGKHLIDENSEEENHLKFQCMKWSRVSGFFRFSSALHG